MAGSSTTPPVDGDPGSERGDGRVVLVLDGEPTEGVVMDPFDRRPDGRTRLYVALRTGATRRWAVDADADVRVVDATPGTDAASFGDATTVDQVTSPGNLTELGVAIEKQLASCATPLACCVDSVTTLLQYVDVRECYRFLNTATGRFQAADVDAHFHLQPAAHEDRTVAILASLFDDVVDAEAPADASVSPRQ